MVRAISNNDNGSTGETIIQFTAASATNMLPLVRRIVDDLLRLHHAIEAQREQLHVIDQLTDTIDQPDYQEELIDIRGSIDQDQQQFAVYMNELNALGVHAHLPFDGTIDFPTQINRRDVRLCWQPGEATVNYWHETDADKDQRMLIVKPS